MTTESNTPAEAGTAPASLTVNDAADRIDDLFTADPKEDTREVEESGEAQQPETDEAAGEESPAADEDEGKSDDEEKAEVEDGEQPLTRVKLKDGREVTLEELEKGYLRQSDFTRKTQEVAETRKQVEAATQQITQQAQTLQQQLQIARAVVEAHMPPRPDPALLQFDPTGYYQQEKTWELAAGKLQQIAQAQVELGQRAQYEQSRVLQDYVGKEQGKLLEAMPELKDESKRKAVYEELISGLSTHYGLSAEEVSRVHNHQLVIMARDAIAYRKLQAAKPQAKAKAADAPPVVKPTARAPYGSVKEERFKSGVKALRQTGRRDVAERLLEDF
jgi:hypothetical protein